MSTAMRTTVAVLSLSAAGFVGILTREGYSERAYPDPVHGAAVPTIGYGSTHGVKLGDTTNPVQAAQRTLREVRSFEGTIKPCMQGIELTQGEYDVYVQLAHNIGPGAYCRSTLVKRLHARQYEQACGQILAWKMSGGIDCSVPGNDKCEGLWSDRLRLHRQCLEAQP